MRAIVGHLARAGVVQPAPSAPDRVTGRLAGSGTAARSRSAAPRPRRARACAGASTARCGRGSRARTCRREGILRHFGDRAAPAPDGPCCDVCDPVARARAAARRPSGAPARGRPSSRTARRRGRPRRARRGDPRRRGVGRSPRSAARGRSRSCAAGSRRSSRSTPTTACRTTAPGRTSPDRPCSSGSTRCSTAGTLRSTGGRFPKLEVA